MYLVLIPSSVGRLVILGPYTVCRMHLPAGDDPGNAKPSKITSINGGDNRRLVLDESSELSPTWTAGYIEPKRAQVYFHSILTE